MRPHNEMDGPYPHTNDAAFGDDYATDPIQWAKYTPGNSSDIDTDGDGGTYDDGDSATRALQSDAYTPLNTQCRLLVAILTELGPIIIGISLSWVWIGFAFVLPLYGIWVNLRSMGVITAPIVPMVLGIPLCTPEQTNTIVHTGVVVVLALIHLK